MNTCEHGETMSYAENQTPLPRAYSRGHIYPEGRGKHLHDPSGVKADPVVVAAEDFTEHHALSANKTTRPLITVATNPRELTNPYPLSVSTNTLSPVIGVSFAPTYAQLNENGETKITQTLVEHDVRNDVYAEEHYIPQGTGLPYESFKLVFTNTDITPELVEDLANVVGNVENWSRYMSPITGKHIEAYPESIPIQVPHPDSPPLTGSVKSYNRVFDETQDLPSLDDTEMLLVEQQRRNVSRKRRHETSNMDVSDFSPSDFDDVTTDLSTVLTVVVDIAATSTPVTAETIVEYTKSINGTEDANTVLRMLEQYGYVKQVVKGIWEPTAKTQNTGENT